MIVIYWEVIIGDRKGVGLVQDLKENTEYTNYTKDSRVIVWLWEILGSLDKSDKAAFLQFVTGWDNLLEFYSKI